MLVDMLRNTLQKPPKAMESEKMQRCLHFSTEMKKMGIIKSTNTVAYPTKSGIEQLKLLSIAQLPKS